MRKTKYGNRIIISMVKSDSNESDYTEHQLLQEQFDSLQKTIDDGNSIIENRNFEIAAGGLVLSLTILSLLSSLNKLPSNYEWIAVIIWLLFTISIILHYFSQFISIQCAQKLQDDIARMIRNRQAYDDIALRRKYNGAQKELKVINSLTSVFMLLGILGLVAYTGMCIIT